MVPAVPPPQPVTAKLPALACLPQREEPPSTVLHIWPELKALVRRGSPFKYDIPGPGIICVQPLKRTPWLSGTKSTNSGNPGGMPGVSDKD